MRRFSNGHSFFISLLSYNTNVPAPTLFSRRWLIIISLPIKFCLQILRTLFVGENQIFTQLHIRKHNKNYQPLISSPAFFIAFTSRLKIKHSPYKKSSKFIDWLEKIESEEQFNPQSPSVKFICWCLRYIQRNKT